jgi:hypothetical protein
VVLQFSFLGKGAVPAVRSNSSADNVDLYFEFQECHQSPERRSQIVRPFSPCPSLMLGRSAIHWGVVVVLGRVTIMPSLLVVRDGFWNCTVPGDLVLQRQRES